MKTLIILIIASIFCFVGCGTSTHSFGISTEYEGIPIKIDYSYSPEKSKDVGAPVLVGKDAPAGKDLIALTTEQIDILNEMIPAKEDPIKAASARPDTFPTGPVHPAKDLLQKIKAYKKEVGK